MKIISVRNVENFVPKVLPKISIQNKKTVEKILSEVKKNGDSAVKKYEKKFGGLSGSIRVSAKEVNLAYSKVSKTELDAIKLSKNRLSKTETEIKKRLKDFSLKSNGVKISKKFSPLESVGCYVPGGLARYPSSVIMSVIPAKIAGVKRIVVVSPSSKDGKIDPLTLVAADICGANEIYKIGGAHAIGALAYGTKTIKSVDKIVGPGGSFVTIAKSLVNLTTSIDMLAGPTELGIIADISSNPDIVAVDMISQAEHSKDTFCYAITTSSNFAKKIQTAITEKCKTVKRSNIVTSSLNKNGFIAVCKNESDVIKLANNLAPEHLQILTKNSQKIAKQIKNAGLVLVGANTPSSASDYMLGSNHILPTNQFGKTRGSLSVLDFMKLGTEITSTKDSLKTISKYMKALTFAEDLPNHYEAVRNRL